MMIRSLRKRLAALLILAISLALLGASGAALWVSERQLTVKEEIAFLGRLDLLVQDVRMEGSVRAAQLAQTEIADKLVLTIYDNGQPILFPGGWQPVTPRAELFEGVKLAAERAGVSVSGGLADARYTGELRGREGERYLAALQTVGGYRSQRAVAMLMDMRAQDAQRGTMRLLFAAITLGAMIVMAAFGWLFTAYAARPIAQAHAGQNAFVAAASHELRTPLQIMQSNLDALKNAPDDPRRFTAAMQRELDRMGRLSEDLALLASVQGDMDALSGPVEPLELAQAAALDHRDVAREKGIALKLIDPEAPLPLVKGDSSMLRRALNVLVDNAVCYTPEGGHVEITLKTERAQVLLCVRDDGPGIAPEHQMRIFERFYRVDHSRSDRSHSGLGLCVAREIVERHGGQLLFENVSPHGSRFTIRLPRL